jgi:hypothetical protein
MKKQASILLIVPRTHKLLMIFGTVMMLHCWCVDRREEVLSKARLKSRGLQLEQASKVPKTALEAWILY